MTVKKRDQYKECNDQPEVLLKDFELQFCSRCVRPDCTRSQHGRSKFDQRVTTWESRLFIDVPRMSPEDPRFVDFQAKRFREIDTTAVPNIQGRVQDWVDPRDLDAEYEIPETKKIESAIVSDEDEQGPAKAPEPVPSTPDRRGKMLGGKKVDEKLTRPVLDPWEPKKQTPTEGKIVKPGAKIRLGGS